MRRGCLYCIESLGDLMHKDSDLETHIAPGPELFGTPDSYNNKLSFIIQLDDIVWGIAPAGGASEWCSRGPNFQRLIECQWH